MRYKSPYCKHGHRPGECATCERVERADVVAVAVLEPPAETTSAIKRQRQKREGSHQYVMAAAAVLPPVFTETQLLLEAWKLCPRKFGLRGAENQHPDARRLAVCLFGAKGLIAQGLLVRGKVRGTLAIVKEQE